jgi:signal transduction histidine kinase
MTGQLWRVVAVFRVVTLAYAAALILRNHDSYQHPAAGLAVLAIMTGWTVLMIAAYRRPAWRSWPVISADLAVAAVLVVSTSWIDTAARIAGGAPTLPSTWSATPVLACAVAGGPWGGLAGAVVVAAADGLERPHLVPGHETFNGIVLLLIAGGVGGYVVRVVLRAEASVALAARREAVVAERERIARGIHDSVLQVLALVSSRGRALGGEAADLGQLAAEQEAALRALVSDQHAAELTGDGTLDVLTLLEPLSGAQALLSAPATPVLLPEMSARALAGAVSEALDNVRHHGGPGAKAWVLVEDEGSAVAVTVRDDGAGFAPGRLAEAAAAGRFGVSHSIVGRMREAGGLATLTSSPGGGTEVELRVSRS